MTRTHAKTQTIATAQISSDLPAEAFFERWADMATWQEWNTDTEWVRLDGPFQTGATGVLKPKGGPKTKFVVAALEPGREFTDVSLLAGAKLTFRHLVDRAADGRTTVAVTVSLGGPLAFFWNTVLGKGIKNGIAADLTHLEAAARAKFRAAA
ncbi:SRPBCC family protein [Hamadaea tsunoensis]|uniref:SRPBCC family protein n=1 Tax=Hamadaea tsunoensis TaxID=53368 RepID=UPI00041C1053|nr:SRPBCC family protein [Hamadaea tsunoensis]